MLDEYPTSELFTAAERVALELADAMTATPPSVTDELFARLQQHYDEAQLVELAAIVAQELRMRSPELLAALASAPGGVRATELRIRVRPGGPAV